MPLGGIAIGAGAIAGPVIGGIIGSSVAADNREAAQRAAAAAVAEIEKVQVPTDLQAPVYIKYLRQAGIYNPELEQQITLGASKVSQIQEDAQTRDTQIQALQMLKSRAQGGLTPEDQANFAQLRMQTAADTQGKIGQIQQQYQSRGLGGAGGELAASLSAAQGGSQTEAMGGLNLSAARSMASQNALAQLGGLAGAVRGQDFGIAQQKASAEDLVNQFNTAQAINRQQRNTQSLNQAQAANLAETQRVGDINVQLYNQELYRQKQAEQQQFEDQMMKASAMANANLGQANMLGNLGQQQAQMWSGIGTGVGQGFGAMGNYFSSKNKTNTGSNSTN